MPPSAQAAAAAAAAADAIDRSNKSAHGTKRLLKRTIAEVEADEASLDAEVWLAQAEAAAETYTEQERLWTTEEEEHLEAIRLAHLLDDMEIPTGTNGMLRCRCPRQAREPGLPEWLSV